MTDHEQSANPKRAAEWRKLLEAARRSEEQMRGLLDSAPDAIFVVDETELIVFANAEAETLLGLAAEQLVGRSIKSLVPARLLRRLLALRVNFMAADPSEGSVDSGLDMAVVTVDGHEVPVDLRLALATWEGREAVVISVRDISARKAMEERIRRSAAGARALAEFAGALPALGKDPRSILERVVGILVEAFGDTCGIFVLGDSAPVLDCVAWGSRDPSDEPAAREALARRPMTSEDEPMATLFRTGRSSVSLIVDEADLRRQTAPEYWEIVKPTGAASGMLIPIRGAGDTVSGVITCRRFAASRPYDEEEVHLIEQLAERASLAIQNAELFRRLAEDEERLRILAEISDVLAEVAGTGEMLEEVAQLLARSMGDACGITVVDPENGMLVPAAVESSKPELGAVLERLTAGPLPIADSFSGRAVITGRPLTWDAGDSPEGLPESYGAMLDRLGISHVLVVPLDADGELIGALGLCRDRDGEPYSDKDRVLTEDIAARIAAQVVRARLRERVERTSVQLRTMFDMFPVGMALIDLKGRMLQVNPALCALTGRDTPDLVGEPFSGLTHADDRDDEWDAFEMLAAAGAESRVLYERFLGADGTVIWVRVQLTARAEAGRVVGFAAEVEDITAQGAFDGQLGRQYLHDVVTGLPGRALLIDRLRHGLTRLKRTDRGAAVLFVDLDRFKPINDTFGHAVGDRFLIESARRLTTIVRPPDTIARIGGDEFVIICNDVADETDAEHVAARVIEALSQPFDFDDHELVVSASVGIATTHEPTEDPNDLIHRAETAMYRAKQQGRARFERFTEAIRVDPVEHFRMEADLRHGIDSGQLRLLYQPILALGTGEVRSVEALVRFEHPTLGLLAPDRFLQIAEESGLILPLGYWTIAEACRQLVATDEMLGGPLRMAVNLSMRQLEDPRVVDAFVAAISGSGADPERLVVEITETAYMHADREVLYTIDRLISLGLSMAVDDFGTGYSSLVHLKRFPLRAVKVDQSFIAGLGRNADAQR